MSTVLRNPRTYTNRNRLVTQSEERLRKPGQKGELIRQQELILKQQLRTAKRKQRGNLPNGTLPNGTLPNGHTPVMNGHHQEDDTQSQHSFMDAPEENEQNTQRQNRIFVSIASYRDSELVLTVQDLFSKADHPQNVFVGVYEQNDPETDKAFSLANLLQTPHALTRYYENDQLRVMASPATDAKGPMYARALIEQLYNQEEYYMIIDSHSLFVKGWDTKCLDELAKVPSAKPVLSYFPCNFDHGKRQMTPLELNPQLKLNYLRLLEFNTKAGGVPMPVEQTYKNMPRVPIRSLFWNACFSFAPASMLKEVPFDHQYPYLFLGEEIATNMRLFTHGYEVYNPSQHILFHIKSREYRPTYWELFFENYIPKDASFTITAEDRKVRKEQQQASIQRMSKFMCGYMNPEQYGLGHVHSYADFCEFIGIDFAKQTAKDYTSFGRTKAPSKEEQYAKMAENTSVGAKSAPLIVRSAKPMLQPPARAPLTTRTIGQPMRGVQPRYANQANQPWLRANQKAKQTQSGMMGMAGQVGRRK